MAGNPRQSLANVLHDRAGQRSRRSSDNETVLDSSFFLFPPSPLTGSTDSAQGRSLPPSLPASPNISASLPRFSPSLPSSLPPPVSSSLSSLSSSPTLPSASFVASAGRGSCGEKKQGSDEGEKDACNLNCAGSAKRGSLASARSPGTVSSLQESDGPSSMEKHADGAGAPSFSESRGRRATEHGSSKAGETALSFPDPPSSPGARFTVSRASSPSLASRSRSPDTQLPAPRQSLPCSASACGARAAVNDSRLFSSSAHSASSPPLSPPGDPNGTPLLRPATADAPLSTSLLSLPTSFSSSLGPAMGLSRARAVSVHPSFPAFSPPASAVDRPRGAAPPPFSPPNAASDILSPPPDLVLSPACEPVPSLAKTGERPASFLLSPPMVAEKRTARRGSVPFSPPSGCSEVLSPPPDLLSPCSPLPPLLKESERPGGRLGGQAERTASARGLFEAPQNFAQGRPEKPAQSFFFPPPPSPFGGNASVLRLGAWLAERPGLDDERFTPLLESFLLHFDFLAAGKESRRIQQDQQIQRDLRLGEDEEGEVSFFRPVGKHEEKSEARTGKRDEDQRRGKDQLEEFETTLLDILGLRGGNGVHTSVDILVGQLREKPHRHKATGEEGEPAGGTTGGIRIGEKFFFADKVALKSRLRQILQACDDEEELRGDDFELVKGVLEFHPKAKRKMQNLSGLFVSTHPNPKFRATRCFFIRRTIHPSSSVSSVPGAVTPEGPSSSDKKAGERLGDSPAEDQKTGESEGGMAGEDDPSKTEDHTEVQEECEDFSYVRCVDNMLEDDSQADRLICHILKQLAEAFPGSVAHLHEALRRNFPPLRFSVDALVAYAKNLLWISQHVPQIRALLWKLLVSKMTSIDVEIKLADPNSIDLEQMQVWKREQLALLARQLEKGAVAPSVVQSILGEPQWFCLMYEKVRSEEDIDIMAAKLDGLMRVSFSFLQCFIPQLSGKPAPPGAYREDDDHESVASPSSRSSVADYSPCVDDEPKEEKRQKGPTEKDRRGAPERRSFSEDRKDGSLSPFTPQTVMSPLATMSPRVALSAFPAGRHAPLAPRDPRSLLSPAMSPAPAWPQDSRAPPGLRERSRESRRDKKPLTEADVLVYELMDVFIEVVLPVHKCKYVQFLVFYLANLRVEWAGRLMSLLFRMLFDRQQHMLLRRISAVYISSFLCRALLVPPRFVRLALHHFLQLLHRGFLMTGTPNAARQQQRLLGLLRAQHQTVYNPESPLALFYTVCQSCCYILCYHLDALAKTAPSLAFLKERNTSVAALLTSPLRPLMHIKRGIAREFVAACRRVGTLDSSSDFENALKEVQLRDPPPPSSSAYLSGRVSGATGDEEEERDEREQEREEEREQNREEEREERDGKSISRVDAVASNDILSDVLWLFDPLDAFFPFDRYLLRHSGRFIANKYRDWSAVVAFVMQREEEKKKRADGLDSRDAEDAGDISEEREQRRVGPVKLSIEEERDEAGERRRPSGEAAAAQKRAERRGGDEGQRPDEASLRLPEEEKEELDSAGVMRLTVEDSTDSDAEKETEKRGETEGASGLAGEEDKARGGAAGTESGEEDGDGGEKENREEQDEGKSTSPSLVVEKSTLHTPPIVTQQPQHNLSRELATSEMGALQQLVQDSLGFASASRELEAKVRQRTGGSSASAAAKHREERRPASVDARARKGQGGEEETESGKGEGRGRDGGDGVSSGSPERDATAEEEIYEGGEGEREIEEGEEEEADDERCIGNESDEEGWGVGNWDSLSALFSDEEQELEEKDFQEDGDDESESRGGRALPALSSQREDETMDEAGDRETATRRQPRSGLQSQPSFDASANLSLQSSKNVGPSLRRSRSREAKRDFSFLAPSVAASIADQLELEVDAVGDEALSQSNLCLLRHQSCLSRASMLDIFLSSQAYRPAPASPVVSATVSPFLGPSQPPLTGFPREKLKERQRDPLASPPTLAIAGEPTEPAPMNFVLTPSASFLPPSLAFSSPGWTGDELESDANRAVVGGREETRQRRAKGRAEARATGSNPFFRGSPSASSSLGVIQENEGEAGTDDASGEQSGGSDREKAARGQGRRRSADSLDEAVKREEEKEARETTRQDSEVPRPRLKRRHTVDAFSGFPSRPLPEVLSAAARTKSDNRAPVEPRASPLKARALEPQPPRSLGRGPGAPGEGSEGEADRGGDAGDEECREQEGGNGEEEAETKTGVREEETHPAAKAEKPEAALGEKRGKNGKRRKKKRGEKEIAETGSKQRTQDAEREEGEAPEGARRQAGEKEGKAPRAQRKKKIPSSPASAVEEKLGESRPSITILPCPSETDMGSSSSPCPSSPVSSSSSSSSLSLSPSALSPSSLFASSRLPTLCAAASATGPREEGGRKEKAVDGESPLSLGSEDRRVSQLDRVLHTLREREEQLKAQQAEVQRTQEALLKMLLHEKQKREERRKKKERRKQEAKTDGDSEAEATADLRRQSEEPCVAERGMDKAKKAEERESFLSGEQLKTSDERAGDAGKKETKSAQRDPDGQVLATCSSDLSKPGAAEQGERKKLKTRERREGETVEEEGEAEERRRGKKGDLAGQRKAEEQAVVGQEETKKERRRKGSGDALSPKNVEENARGAEGGNGRGVSPETKRRQEKEELRSGRKKSEDRKAETEACPPAEMLEQGEAPAGRGSPVAVVGHGTEKKKKKKKPKCHEEQIVPGADTETAPEEPTVDTPLVKAETLPGTPSDPPTPETMTEKKKKRKKKEKVETAGTPESEDPVSIMKTEELPVAVERTTSKGPEEAAESATGVGDQKVERKKKPKEKKEEGNAPCGVEMEPSLEAEDLNADGEQDDAGETEPGSTVAGEGKKKKKKKKKREAHEDEQEEEGGAKKAKPKKQRMQPEEIAAGQFDDRSEENREGKPSTKKEAKEGKNKEERKQQERKGAEICDGGNTAASKGIQEERGKTTHDEKESREEQNQQVDFIGAPLRGKGESGKEKKKKKKDRRAAEADEEAMTTQELAAEEVKSEPPALETCPVFEEGDTPREREKKKSKKKRKRQERETLYEDDATSVAVDEKSAETTGPGEGSEEKEKVKQQKKKRRHESNA
ncbi:conserved hypothetical protein [Neospora caninum Liverpool]|uniref:RNA polymerase I specific transcription initiation factor RRN3 n=1 Tax=Neospora caninum (strain Liverpool) TaxID=572307 RepID=F0VDI9_NEOCL|nr:conserved hypothetical protein [Neospora caninum Liverpool]CBZ51782.1 conserved hypothetical protein [Neospora caninum Liverpool]CEL65739.1 TPA: hypothetical protein BN1204_015740 [Neospora caninum Liverpool]|eukprot:XP_003881815.1 conserved hypothetical protein [Neospora caninum Liverpool]